MTKEEFEKGIENLTIAFPKLEMTKEMAEVWYKYSKDISDEGWQNKITNCIRGCHRVPTLADIIDQSDYYNQEFTKEVRDRAKQCFSRNPGCYNTDTSKTTCSYCYKVLRS